MESILKLLASIVIFWVVALGPAIIALVIPVALQKKAYKKYINPMTQSMRRPPGATLLARIIYLDYELLTPIMNISLVLPALLTYHYISTIWLGIPDYWSVRIALALICLAVYIYYGRQLLTMRAELRNLRLGYECELAVAQELDMLMLSGYRVFHDIPAEGFNIDHLVVGKTGVFAVETKGRSKHDKGKKHKQAQARVRYDGNALHFPNKTETAPIKQTSRQAKWASEWLTAATGMQVTARPVVVLPGWFVEWPQKSTVVAVLPGKKLDSHFLKQNTSALNDQEVQRIAYQIDQKVRDLKPGEVARVK